MQKLLPRAAKQVPVYRAWWNEHKGIANDRLENWPILEKESIRRAPESFVEEGLDLSKFLCEQTSGSTGTPLKLWWSRETTHKWYALFEARWRLWNGVSRKSRWAILGGQLIVPVSQTKPPFWVSNMAFQQLYLSSYHLKPEWIGYYLDAIEQHRAEYLWGYTSALVAIARGAIEANRRLPGIRVVLTNGEPLEQQDRELLQAAFNCPVRETYGLSEIVTAASECTAGTLHSWPEVGVIEVLDENNRPVPPGTVGDLVCTGLLNSDMPLIRYRTGDRAALAPPGTLCSCGRALPIMRCVEGRSDDVLYTTDGRSVGRLDPVLKSDLPIVESQIIQEATNRIRFRYVAAEGFTDLTEKRITEQLQQRLGKVQVVWERMDYIPRSANGKLRTVLCTIPDKERLGVPPLA
ncbi:MAG: AMP-binding protein [Acidobacteriota bacterium]